MVFSSFAFAARPPVRAAFGCLYQRHYPLATASCAWLGKAERAARESHKKRHEERLQRCGYAVLEKRRRRSLRMLVASCPQMGGKSFSDHPFLKVLVTRLVIAHLGVTLGSSLYHIPSGEGLALVRESLRAMAMD
jgi:hypothetical protein